MDNTHTNSLDSILNTILTNKVIQKASGLYDIMIPYIHNNVNNLPKKCYELIIKKLSGKNIDISKINILKLKRYVMMLLPPNPNIENLLDTKYKINKIENKEDRASVIYYLSKS